MKVNNIFLILFLVFSSHVNSQISEILNKKDNDIKLSALPYYSFGKGIGITSPDSVFQFNIRFRMQNRVTYFNNEDEKPSYDGQIRRLRLRFDGFVGNSKFLYALQLSFAPGDVGEIQEGENINIIRDAVVFYRPNKFWSFGFGQTKLPGNRQRVNSSGGLQLTDRSINNARFNIDRDFGFQSYYLNENKEKFSYNIKSAVSSGEGRNITGKSDDGIALTGKLELMPLGSFTKDGTNFEGDLVREKKPKLLISGAFQQNNQAQRTQGQLGDYLFEKRTMQSVLLDGMFKYNGWSIMASYMSRNTLKSAITFDSTNLSEFNYVFVGKGLDYQISYLLQSDYEFIARYSIQNVDKIIKLYTPNTNQYSIGMTKYIWEHAFKLQTEITYDSLSYFDASKKNNWYFRFQVEIGI